MEDDLLRRLSHAESRRPDPESLSTYFKDRKSSATRQSTNASSLADVYEPLHHRADPVPKPVKISRAQIKLDEAASSSRQHHILHFKS
jgi:hypothetical protein